LEPTTVQQTNNATLSGRVILDEHIFADCQFVNAELVYTGGKPPALIRCGFENARLAFEGPAEDTLNYLRALAGSSADFRNAVLALMPELRPDAATGTGTVTFRSAND